MKKYNFNVEKYAGLLEEYIHCLEVVKSEKLEKALKIRETIRQAFDGETCMVDGETYGIAVAYAKRVMAA